MEAQNSNEERTVQDIEAAEPSVATPPEDPSGEANLGCGTPHIHERILFQQKSDSPANEGERFLSSSPVFSQTNDGSYPSCCSGRYISASYRHCNKCKDRAWRNTRSYRVLVSGHRAIHCKAHHSYIFFLPFPLLPTQRTAMSRFSRKPMRTRSRRLLSSPSLECASLLFSCARFPVLSYTCLLTFEASEPDLQALVHLSSKLASPHTHPLPCPLLPKPKRPLESIHALRRNHSVSNSLFNFHPPSAASCSISIDVW